MQFCHRCSPLVLLIQEQVLDGGVSLDTILLSDGSVNSGVQSSEVHLTLELRRGICPWSSQGLAVTTPGSEELHQDTLLIVQHLLLPVTLGQLNHILATSWFRVRLAASSTTTSSLASRLLIHHLPGSSQTSINHTLGVSGSLVVLWLVLVSTKYLDGGESLDTILSSQLPVLISIDCSHLDNTLQS